MMKSQNSAIGRSHVVWLDVVRFVAMFTVVCCHSTDPFNFYPGEPPANIDQIKFCCLWVVPTSLRPPVCDDHGSFAAASEGRYFRLL